MKLTVLLFSLLIGVSALTQEIESDLFASLHSSSLHIFMQSEKSKLSVITYRNSKKDGMVEETTSTYRKGKINPLKLNFNVKYTEHYVLEDRKRSLGKYQFKDDEIFKYERTDFDNRNARLYTFYHYFIYQNEVVEKEIIRTKEYVGQGSVDMDTVVYKDSVIYSVIDHEDGFKQENLTDPGVYTTYVISEGRLDKKTTYFDGFNESVEFTYDTKGHLVNIKYILTGEENKSITTHTEIHYSIDGLMTETNFYDESNEVLERKVYTYK